ncbi:MAG: hypothetical protein ACX930_04575 [Erythrobacter sp.]
MQTLGESAAIDPVYISFVTVMVVGALSLWVLRSAFGDKEAGDPLQGLFDSSTFETRLDSVAERAAPPRTSRTMPPHASHGARAQMARLREVWGMDTRAEAIEGVARVMRASKGRTPAPVEVIDHASAIAESEWEEVKLLPPPSSEAA